MNYLRQLVRRYRQGGCDQIRRSVVGFASRKRREFRTLGAYLANGNARGALSYGSRMVLGRDLYLAALRRRHNGELLVSFPEGRLILDLHDEGLSRELLTRGRREIVSAAAFTNALEQLAATTTGPVTVAEVGANIGYYVLLECATLDDQANVIAFEPSPRNVAFLERNLALNGLEERVEVHQQAVGDRQGEARLRLSTKSNWNRIETSGIDPPRELSGTSVPVDILSLESFLGDHSRDPKTIDAVRLDVQGYEVEVFAGMEPILAADHPMVIFVETHPNYIEPARHARMIDRLRTAGFKLLSAADDDRVYDVSSLSDDRVYDTPMELVLQRGLERAEEGPTNDTHVKTV